MIDQWLRQCSLIVSSSGSRGLELGDLRVTFAVRKGDLETPNSAEIRVYNLSADTANRIRREFTRVVLMAGYSQLGIIFDGTIRQVRQGRENGTDSWLEIIAADGDGAYNFATVNTTLAAGSTPADRVGVCQSAMEQKGAGQGYVPDLGSQALPRGKVMYGMARDHMRGIAETTDSAWSIQDGKVQMLPRNGYLPGAAVVLTHETGLVGTPEQTQDGIKVRALLNPQLRIGARVKLDNASVQRVKTDLKANTVLAPALDHDGIYRVLTIEYRGDTRGNDWYADMVCLGIDDTSRVPLDVAR
jgi:hypothetical protein